MFYDYMPNSPAFAYKPQQTKSRPFVGKGSLMNRKQYAGMLKDILETHRQGGDVPACIAKYNERYKYVYVFNDSIFKLLFGAPENESITVDFLNAALRLYGSDCIEHLAFVNPAVPSAFSKNSTSDVVVTDQHLDRIVLEVQHVEDETFNDRLVFYAAKHTVANLVHGQGYKLRSLNLVSLQMFDAFPESKNYVHTVRLKNQENEEFFKKQTITLVEVPKFLKEGFETDTSRFAQWLRMIDGLNEETPVSVPAGSQFALLQKRAELSKFTADFLVSEAMKMSDREYELYVEKKHARAEGRAEGHAEGRAEGRAEGKIEAEANAISVMRQLGLSPEQIAEAKARLAALNK